MELAARHPDWVFGFEDETWWSRLAQPQMHAWTDGDGEPLRLVEKELTKEDTEPKALCCYGLLRLDTDRIWLCFVDGRPVSQVTVDFLKWVLEGLESEGKRVFVLTWDNASWHISQMVRIWIRQYNQMAKRGSVREVMQKGEVMVFPIYRSRTKLRRESHDQEKEYHNYRRVKEGT
jgi:hypothetical protein